MKKNRHMEWILRRAAWAVLLALWSPVWALAQEGAPVDWDALVLDGPRPDAVADELIVMYREGAVRAPAEPLPRGRAAMGRRTWRAPESAAELHRRAGAREARAFGRVRGEHVRLRQGGGRDAMREAAEIYMADPAVLRVEPNYMYYPLAVPDDPRYPELWGMRAIGAEEAWDITTGSRDVVVAVIDTGIGGINQTNSPPFRSWHEDLDDNIWTNPFPGHTQEVMGVEFTYTDDFHGWNFMLTPTFPYGHNAPIDDNGHGTHVAGTIGAVGNNALGVVGVNWAVSLVPLKTLGPNGGDTVNAVHAIEYLSWFDGEEGRPRIHMSNNSWGGPGFSTPLLEAIRLSRDKGQLFVVAAGNDNRNIDSLPTYPASYDVDNILVVAAVAEDPEPEDEDVPEYIRSAFSNYGRETVHVGAPGGFGNPANRPVNILSTVPPLPAYGFADYTAMPGTSMACPHVTGAAALLLAYAPHADYLDLKVALIESARANPVPDLQDTTITGGMIHIPTAMRKLPLIRPFDSVIKVAGPWGGHPDYQPPNDPAMYTGLPAEFVIRNLLGADRPDMAFDVWIEYENAPPEDWLDLWWGRGGSRTNLVNMGQAFSDVLPAGSNGVMQVWTNQLTSTLGYGIHTAYIIMEDTRNGACFTNTVSLKITENYALQTPPGGYEWLEPGTGYETARVEYFETDGLYQAQFDFMYYGESLRTFSIGQNGIIVFGPYGAPVPQRAGLALPLAAPVGPYIMPYWGALAYDPLFSRVDIDWFAAPERCVVTWRGMRPRGESMWNGDAALDFQVVLYSHSSITSHFTLPHDGVNSAGEGYDIRFNYRRVAQDHDLGGGRTATVGVQDPGGYVAKVYAEQGTAPERWFLPQKLVPPGEPMCLADEQSILFTWYRMLPWNNVRPHPVKMEPLVFLPGSMVPGYPGWLQFELRFNEIIMDLRKEDFEFSPDSMPGLSIDSIRHGGERFIVDIEGAGERYGRVRIRLKSDALADNDPAKSNAVYNLHDRWNAGMGYFDLAASPVAEVHLWDDFESGPGLWTCSDDDFNMKTTKGWELGKPAVPPLYFNGPREAFSGDNCWGTKLAQNCPPGMNAWVRSPEVFLGETPMVDFRFWADLPWESEGWLEISDGGGFEIFMGWNPKADEPSVPGTNGWKRFTRRLPSKYANQTVQFQFRVSVPVKEAFEGDPSGNAPGLTPGLYFDDFLVVSLKEPGLHLVEAIPDVLEASDTVPLATVVYNSTLDRMQNAAGIYGSADAALQVLTKGAQYYGTMEWGGLFTNTFVEVETAAPGAYRSNKIPLLHDGFDGLAFLTAGSVPLWVDTPAAAQPYTFRAFTSGHVVDWMGYPLQGGGSAKSALFQLIYAGPSGTISPAAADGGTTGENTVLYTHVEGIPYARFGARKVAADLGLFDRVFSHNLPAGAKVFVRAWDAASFDASLAYGNSGLYTIQRTAGEAHDFGGWTVGTPTQWHRDSNGDGLPDGWGITRPSYPLDPRVPVGPLDPRFDVVGQTPLKAVVNPDINNANYIYKPRRAVAGASGFAADYVFSANRREGNGTARPGQIQVWNRNLSSRVASYQTFIVPGGTGTYTLDPASLCLSADGSKLYVATGLAPSPYTLGSRILMFHVTPGGLLNATANGTLTASAVFPPMSADDVLQPYLPGRFNNIVDIVWHGNDTVVVVDQEEVGGAYRLQRVDLAAGVVVTPATLTVSRANLGGNDAKPYSLAQDDDYYYVGSGSMGETGRVFALSKTGGGNIPSFFSGLNQGDGVSVGIGGHYYVMERMVPGQQGGMADVGQLRVRSPLRGVETIYRSGLVSDYDTPFTPFYQPEGVFVDKDHPYHRVLVADTGNNRLLWLRLYLDVNGDGIDDVWASHYFGHPDACDPWGDPDGDGLVNIGEYHGGTNPLDPESNNQWDIHNPGLAHDGFPEVVSVIASTNLIYACDNTASNAVRLEVKFSQNVTGWLDGANPNIQLVFGDGSQTGDLALVGALGGDTYLFAFNANYYSPTGWVEAVISGARNTATPSKTMDPVRDGFPLRFYIEWCEGAPDDRPGGETPGVHEGDLYITEFSHNPLRFRWKATAGVQYWIVTSTDLGVPSQFWKDAYNGYFESPPMVIVDGQLEFVDEHEDGWFDYDDPKRFFRVTTDEPDPGP